MLVLGFASDFSVAERNYSDCVACIHIVVALYVLLYLVDDIIILVRHKLKAWHLLYEQQQCFFRIIIPCA